MNEEPTGRVLVVGGYGAVGAAATACLSAWLPGRVLPAGRDAARARRLGGVRVDVADPVDFERVLDTLADVAAVVFCVEPPDAGPARQCFERGIHVVDVGASHRLLDAVAAMSGPAADAGAAAILSVGLAPGLTNLLAARAHDEVEGADRIDVSVLIGAGERHGIDAVRWTVTGLGEPVRARPMRTELPGLGARTVHPFPFSDQHTLARTLDVPEVTTRFCLDSRPLTAALFALRRTALARRPALLTAAFGRMHLGGEGFAVRADARRAGRSASWALTGHGQSRISGLVAAHATRELVAGRVPPGVHHIEQLPTLADLPERLGAHGVTVWRRTGGSPA